VIIGEATGLLDERGRETVRIGLVMRELRVDKVVYLWEGQSDYRGI
jgi:hypothetical protein